KKLFCREAERMLLGTSFTLSGKEYKNPKICSTQKRKQGKWEDGGAGHFLVTHLGHNQIARSD
ncbi:MAG: hypothetical protein KC584_11030, partial [Nitrospira sp.]|nr:hypothetical protein [Nitrospira sp.]